MGAFQAGWRVNMHWTSRWSILLRHVTLVGAHTDLELLLQNLCVTNRCQVLAFANAHAFNSAADSKEFFEAINSANTVLRDGSGMAIFYRMLGIKPGLNLNGTDLIPKIVQRFDGETIALFGTQDPFLSNAAAFLGTTLVANSQLVTKDGFQATEVYLRLTQEAKPKLIILGMGMPKQEKVAAQLYALGYPCVIICGGAIIDFMGGKTRRAPKWLRSVGLEWVYRLTLEPRRLGSRYLMGNLVFFLRAIVYSCRYHAGVSK
jgi:N-acetylglucosaminyldiphosphoundecaprenol N-acetyl-beta-D-mannosaminyltransferase